MSSSATPDRTAPDYAAPWSARTWAAILAVLSLGTVLVHGFHPFSEDGGLYAAGIEYTLDPTLFPHFTAFVTEHLRFSLFAPVMAFTVRATHLSLPSVLLLIDLVTAFATLAAARELLRRCFAQERAHLAGLALLAAGWTLPIAGTSLFLMDPYVTARNLSMPLSLLAIACALDTWSSQPADTGATLRRPPLPTAVGVILSGAKDPRISPVVQLQPRENRHSQINHPAVRCAACLLLAAAFHPLMAAYAGLFVAALRATKARRRWPAWSLLTFVLLLLCFLVNRLAPAESAAEKAAIVTRYYWFLSQWHWYERLGLLGPLAMLVLVAYAARRPSGDAHRSALRTLCQAAILLGLLGTACALLFAQESAPTHALARLQILRIFLLLYAVMLPLLGATVSNLCTRYALRILCRLPAGADYLERNGGSSLSGCHSAAKRRNLLSDLPVQLQVSRYGFRMLPWLAPAAMAAGMFFAARATYPASPHVELPGRMADTPNPWVQAFLWARDNTPRDALFALDAKYVNTEGEDAQTFRAISLRSALPDYSKDGGEASITPSLAPAWLSGAEAQKNLSELTDRQRDRRLQPFGVTWLVLHASAPTAHPCPYRNSAVKVCRLQP